MRISQFSFPENLTGKRVLDVGTWDGWFAMEMARRGADVVAVDRWENPRFYEIRDLLGIQVDYRNLSVYDLDPADLGTFDIVLFMGVLYHLKHPLLAFERVASVAKDVVAVESFVLTDKYRPGLGVEEHPLMEFYERNELGGQVDNWVAPTVPCLMALCRTAGFARVDLNMVHEYGAVVTCHRTWRPRPTPRPAGAPAMRLLAAFHSDSGGVNFRASSSDDYVTCRVSPEGGDMAPGEVFPEVGGYGVQPVFVGMAEGQWQVNFKLPPGLAPGWHDVRMHTSDRESNALQIAVDVPLTTDGLEVLSAADAVSWEPLRASLRSGFLAVWVKGLPRNADIANVRVDIAGRRQTPTFVGASGGDGVTQLNVALNPRTPPGEPMLQLRLGAAEAPPFRIELTA